LGYALFDFDRAAGVITGGNLVQIGSERSLGCDTPRGREMSFARALPSQFRLQPIDKAGMMGPNPVAMTCNCAFSACARASVRAIRFRARTKTQAQIYADELHLLPAKPIHVAIIGDGELRNRTRRMTRQTSGCGLTQTESVGHVTRCSGC